jgi:hypothetical protein
MRLPVTLFPQVIINKFNMNKFRTALVLTLVLASSSLHATVTLTTAIGELRDSTGTTVPIGTTMVLVSGTSGFGNISSLSSDLSGVNLQSGVSFGTGYKILSVAGATDLNPPGGSFGYGTQAEFNVTGLTTGTGTSGTDLAILWFPGLTGTAPQAVANGQSFGFFRSDTIDSATYGGPSFVTADAISFNTPTDGSAYQLSYTDTNLGGGIATSSFNATGVVSGVPEPSRSMLVLIGATCLLGRRKRI